MREFDVTENVLEGGQDHVCIYRNDSEALPAEKHRADDDYHQCYSSFLADSIQKDLRYWLTSGAAHSASQILDGEQEAKNEEPSKH